VTLNTSERPPREIDVNTSEFSDISLSYAVRIAKGQGLTAETAGILTGGWQTGREHIYTEASRARERTDIYVSREDLGEEGMDTGAIERLAKAMSESHAKQASITTPLAGRAPASALEPGPEHGLEPPGGMGPAPASIPHPAPAPGQPPTVPPRARSDA
jgi:hypothetical protein